MIISIITGLVPWPHSFLGVAGGGADGGCGGRRRFNNIRGKDTRPEAGTRGAGGVILVGT